MVPFPFLSLLLLSSVGEVTASVLFGRQWPPSDGTTTLAVDKRQETAIVTKFSTIFAGGDASRTRTAESGYDIRVDVENGAWGFCATNNPNQCDMVGVCVDKSSCSKGCGWGNTDLVTRSCSSPAGFCSTALLTLENDSSRAFTYLACANKPRTEEFMAFTTTTTTTTTKSTASSSPPSPSPTPPQTTGTAVSQTASSTTSPTSTTDASTPSPTPSPDSPNNNNNTTAIIGAMVGCVALICICVVAIFLIRRSRNAPAAAAKENGGGQDSATQAAGALAAWENKAPLPPSAVELPGKSLPAYEMAGWGRGYPAASPVELPGAGGWGR